MLRRSRVDPDPRLTAFDFRLGRFPNSNTPAEPGLRPGEEDEASIENFHQDAFEHGQHFDNEDEAFMLPTNDLPPIVLHQMRVHESDESWLADQLQREEGSRAVRVLEVQDNRLLLLMAPSHHLASRTIGTDTSPLVTSAARQQRARMDPFCFIHIRLLAFDDGARFCCHCNNPGCPRNPATREKFAREMSCELHRGMQYSDKFANEPALCKCAEAVIAHLWGSVGHVGVNSDLDSDSMASFYMEAESLSAFPWLWTANAPDPFKISPLQPYACHGCS